MRNIAVVIAIACGIMCPYPAHTHAQAVQAVESLREVARSARQAAIDSSALLIAERIGSYRFLYATLENVPRAANVRAGIDRTIRAGEEALRSRDEPEVLRRALEEFRILEADLLSTNRTTRSAPENNAAVRQLAAMDPVRLPVPQSHALVPDVVFTIGPEAHLARGSRSVASAGISTNLLGAVAGAAFDILGSDELKQYFTKNVTAGTSIPLTGSGKLTAQVGLGLGGINLNRMTLWPVLNVESLDRADERLPGDLAPHDENAGQWSSPIVSIAVVPFSSAELQRRLEAGQLVPIPVLGLRTPFYYPGDPFATLASLFTADRREFLRAGPVQFTLGVSVPLLRVGPSPDR